MYVCICNSVTEKQIRRAKAAGADTLGALRDTLGVATGCGSCAEMAASILDEGDDRSAPPGPVLYFPSAA
jgi:bacterioferritin-associated ferredoxin